jgi:GT2 family glycosyltransferase
VTPDVSILIVTYQCRDAVGECLESLYSATTDVSFEVIVVDNASTDGTVEAIQRAFPLAGVIALPANSGFAAAVNRAAREAKGDYLLLLNPDTLVHPGAIERVVAFARAHPRHGIYGGRTLWPDGSVCPGSCWGKPTLWSTFCFATMLSTAFRGSPLFDPESLGHWQRDSVREVDVVTGCLLLAERGLWEELGGFDERFFMYGEDVDLGIRAARAGRRPVITPEAVITHTVGVSSETREDKLVLLFTGKATLMRKHWPAVKRELGLGLLAAGVWARAVGASLRDGRDERAGVSAWRPLWSARGEWLRGYPPVARTAEAPGP